MQLQFFHENRKKKMMKTVKVAAAIIKKENAVFATMRGYGPFKGGWEFPGGKTEKGETSEEAVIREIREELELDIRPEKLFYSVEYDYPDFHLSMDCFLCNIVKGSPVLKEHLDGRWLTVETLDSVSWLPADRDLIYELKRYLAKM